MKLENVANISLGMVLSRIQANPNIGGVTYPLFTIQELAYELGQYNTVIEKQQIEVDEKKLDKRLIAKEGGVIIGLTSSNKAIVVDISHQDEIIPSNFAYIEVNKNKLDPYYFTWYFNEHPSVRKQLTIVMQGSIIRALSVQMLRELEVILPPMDMQYKIGRIYELRRRKAKLSFEQKQLEEQLFNQIIIKHLKEDK